MTSPPLLEVKNLSKSFGGVQALDHVNAEFRVGDITAIVGDNGAGKSTLIKAISGVHEPTTGEILIKGNKVDINNTQTARKLGIETVYQEQSLIEPFDAASNLFLNRESIKDNWFGRLFKSLDSEEMREKTRDLLDKIGVELKDLDTPVRNLSGGQRRSIEVGRAVFWGGEILIFDEPANNLGVEQTEEVINLISQLREQFDVTIIVISHDIEYVFKLVDKILVLRNGKKVGEKKIKETEKEEIISLITGAISAEVGT